MSAGCPKINAQNMFQISSSVRLLSLFLNFGWHLLWCRMEDLRAHGDFMKHSEQIRRDHKNMLVEFTVAYCKPLLA
jgi:hypothetical protein